jgi:hypothetical protein
MSETPNPPQQSGQPGGSNQNNNNPGGGGGGRRRRHRRKGGKRPGGGQGQQNTQANGQGQQSYGQNRSHQGGHQGKKPRKNRGRRGGGTPFVGPMDHSYRNGQEANGNFADTYRQPMRTGNGNPPRMSENEFQSPVNSRPDAPARIFCFIEDLFFLAKIQEVSRKLGLKVEFVKEIDPILERASEDVPENERPALVVFDLNNNNIKPLTLIPKLRTKLKKSASIIGFVSHVQGDLKVKAQEAGCDMVMPRSAFSQNLPNLLRRHGTAEDEAQDMAGNRI